MNATALSLWQVRVLAVALAIVGAGALSLAMTTSVHAAALAPTSTVYQDLTNDGRVDNIRVYFTNVTACAYEAGDWAVGVAGTVVIGGVTGIANTGSCTTDEYINLNVSGAVNITGGAVNPRIDYTNAGTSGSLAADGNIDAANFTATDGTAPIIVSTALSSSGGRNRLTFTYSEAMTVTNGASTTTMGNTTTAGTVAGFGSFATTGNVTVATLKNTVGGSGTSAITIDLADQAGANMASASSTEPSGVVTPLASASVVDGAPTPLQVNTSATGPTATGGGSWDLTKPTITSVTTNDIDNDGRVDTATIVFNSAMRDSNFTNTEGFLGGGAGTFATGTANDATTVFTLTADTLAQDTSPTAAHFTYTPATTSVTDLAGNRVDTATDGSIVAADIVETDGARPVLLLSSPADEAGAVLRNATITLTFSEIVASLTYTLSGDSTSLFTQDISSAAVTLTPNGLMSGAYHQLEITAAPDAATNTFYGVAVGSAATVTNPFNFTTATNSSTSSATSSTTTYDLDVTSPNGGEVLTPGAVETITWSSSGGEAMGFVNINLMYVDGGMTYQETIASGMSNTGTYSWTVPDIDTSSASIQIVGTDLAEALATDASDEYFSISGTATSTDDTADEDTSTEVDTPSTGTTGLSPVTGEVEEISVVACGDYLRSSYFSTVYYIDCDDEGVMTRRPFMDAQTFMTWQSSWDDVSTVTDATLPTMELGGPMLPKAGIVLIKIQSDARVFAIEGDNTIRWITSESVAIANYGSNWADYVIDVAPTLMSRFSQGDDVDSDENGDTGIMKTRAVVNM